LTSNDHLPGHLQKATADLQRRGAECGVQPPPPPPPSPTPSIVGASHHAGQGNRLPGVTFRNLNPRNNP
jgi:hypothetical protein